MLGTYLAYTTPYVQSPAWLTKKKRKGVVGVRGEREQESS
jgi:hypothetical protein